MQLKAHFVFVLRQPGNSHVFFSTIPPGEILQGSLTNGKVSRVQLEAEAACSQKGVVRKDFDSRPLQEFANDINSKKYCCSPGFFFFFNLKLESPALGNQIRFAKQKTVTNAFTRAPIS